MSNHLLEVLQELTTEAPNPNPLGVRISATLYILSYNNPPIGISDIVFTQHSNTITQEQNNKIIKLLIQALEKINKLEERIDKLLQNNIDAEYLARLVKRIKTVEKKQESLPSASQPKVDILGPKVKLTIT